MFVCPGAHTSRHTNQVYVLIMNHKKHLLHINHTPQGVNLQYFPTRGSLWKALLSTKYMQS